MRVIQASDRCNFYSELSFSEYSRVTIESGTAYHDRLSNPPSNLTSSTTSAAVVIAELKPHFPVSSGSSRSIIFLDLLLMTDWCQSQSENQKSDCEKQSRTPLWTSLNQVIR